MKKIKFLLPILVISLGLINTSFAQEKSSRIPPFTLVEAKLPQKAQYVIVKRPMGVCERSILKDVVFTLTDFKEEEGKISLNLVVKNNTKNEFPLVSGYEVLGEPELKPFNVYLISNTGEFYQASNITQPIKLNPYETININLEFENASTENYFFLLFNIYPKEGYAIACPTITALTGPFYLPGTKYLVPNRTVNYKTNQSFSLDNLEEFLRFNISRFTGYRKGGFAMNISMSMIRERKTGEGKYEFFFKILDLPVRKRDLDKKYFGGYLIDNNGNLYFVLPSRMYKNLFSVSSDKKDNTYFDTIRIVPNLIDGAEELTLYLNADQEKYDKDYYISRIKEYPLSTFWPLVEIEGIKVPEQITQYYSK